MQIETIGAAGGADVWAPVPPQVPPVGPPPLPPPPLPPLPPVRHGLVFTGRASEFFGIWFVNLVLTVLTLGIYSAWAKVRTERYFYGNTRVAGTPFEYLAKPLPILYGRLIAYAVVIALGLSWHFQLFVLWLPLAALVMLLLPWVVQRALRFRARYSAWRGLRFRFVDGVYESYVAFLFRPLAQLFTFGLLMPWVRMGQHDYMVRGHRFGGLRFAFHGDLGAYYIPFLISIGLAFTAYLVMLLAVFAGALLGVAIGGDGAGKGPSDLAIALMVAPIALVYLAFLAIPVYLRTKYTNLMWNATSLGPHRFESSLRARDMIWILASNGVLIVLSLGLAVPWAMVRLAKYRAAHMAVWVYGGLDSFGAERTQREGAAGAELVDALDMGMDIGL
ncbi:YjgN family protein [Arenimonas composti]|uniref:DUF898 domain-containing protein n=1 Tax=Arenimonas composti TR7-09 = DSM 18010 TaxID=1121013 RepID=A0A091BC17_9GAMM|nr:YjgN family protein [Arenimonas composti]KFN50218.1 hypothetical protein P873_07625 [Arenimonas composti TR7-09 = DSM 18010]